MRRILYFVVAVVSFAFASCAPSAEKKVETGKNWKAEHVIYIGLDGWGSYSVEKADMPNVKALMAEGCYTLQKRAVLPSSSAVNWATMFMGACPELHGYTTWSSQVPELPSRMVYKNNIFPTIFQLLRDAAPDSEIGCLYEWDGIKYVVDSLSLSYHAEIPKGNEVLKDATVKYIKEKKPALGAFIWDQPDAVGHSVGHDTPEYYAVLKQLDNYVGEIIAAVKEAGIYDNTIFVITSDHGGIEKDHGGKTMMEMETPFIIAGKGIKKGGEFQESMMQFDCASTLASIFGLQQPQVWIGRSMEQIFE